MVGFACGSDRDPRDAAPATSASRGAPPTNIVSNANIRSTRPGTPQRAIMTWAQAVQYGDLASVREAYTQRVRGAVPLARMNAAAKLVGSLLGRPEIITTILDGPRARVRTALVSFGAGGQRSQQPTTFLLRREGGRWLLDDAALLLDSAAAMRRAAG
jgi:hypothetical protein